MKHTEIAKALTKAVEPFVRGMTEEFVAIAAKSVAEQLGIAREHAIAKLREQLEGTPSDVEEHDERSDDGREDDREPPRVRRSHRPAAGRDLVASAEPDRARDPDDAAAGTTEAPQTAEPVAKKTRAKMRCRSCGALGFRSDSCGRTHNIAGSPMHDAIVKAQASIPPHPPPNHCRRVGSVLANRSRGPSSARRAVMPTMSQLLWAA